MSKFGDKFLDMFQLNNDYDDEYDEEYDDYDDEDNKPARGYKRKSREEEYEEDETDLPEKRVKEVSRSSSRTRNSSKVVPMKTGRSIMEVCVIKPTSVEESREVTDTLLSGRAVILNLEGLHVEIAQRIVDFTSGSCYAINGNLQKVSNYIFIITPENVDISGDFQDLLTSGGFDVASFN
ncbi:MAG: cell division protein SepF [Lachnospiraceae bacterium]|nr:cell division protein SepF [Lachnospiraceae bacterium]